jgi:alkylated DNA repair dioxygenase AlkB
MNNLKTFTLTFGDVAENHKGMQQIGNLSDVGFTLNDLKQIKAWFEERECKCKIINLNWLLDENIEVDNSAYILIIKNAVNVLLEDETGSDALFMEQDALEKDTKAFMYGRVVNKKARHNLCFSEKHQTPNYEKGNGTVYAFDEVPLLHRIKCKLREIIGEKGNDLQVEGNYYYDINKCGIGFHGDSERKKVVGLRLGAILPLCFAWFHKNEKISDILTVYKLEHGDMYVMSEKTSGFDWKSSSKYTLRHAAGCSKYTQL